MFFRRFLPSASFKPIILVAVVLSALFINGIRTEAAPLTSTWNLYEPELVYNPLCVFGIERTDIGTGYYVYSDLIDGIFTPIPPDYVIAYVDSESVLPFLCPNSATEPMMVQNTVPTATFSATITSDTYNPGDTISINMSAWSGGSSESGNLLNLFCLFGCSSPPAAGVAANFLGQPQIGCSVSAGCATSGTFTAPTTPGNYTISLNGCWNTLAYCRTSSMEITVGGAPTVNLFFGI